MENFIEITNDGQNIIETNFWASEYARNGYIYVSINDGCYRLLIPKGRKDYIEGMKGANAVLISRGPAMELMPPKSDALEILFEDGTTKPWVITIGSEQIDRLPSDVDRGWKGIMRVFYNTHIESIFEFPVYYRRVKELPYLKPAGE